MKNNRGITLISLTGYIIISVLIIGMLTVITTNFRNNLGNMNTQSMQDTEFDKVNLQILKETKTEGVSINVNQTTDRIITFSNGNTYSYVQADKAIYLNNTIKIAQNIESFRSEVVVINEKQQLTLTITIGETTRITKYIIQN